MLLKGLGQPLKDSQFLSVHIRSMFLLKLDRRQLAVILHLEGRLAWWFMVWPMQLCWLVLGVNLTVVRVCFWGNASLCICGGYSQGWLTHWWMTWGKRGKTWPACGWHRPRGWRLRRKLEEGYLHVNYKHDRSLLKTRTWVPMASYGHLRTRAVTQTLLTFSNECPGSRSIIHTLRLNMQT